VLSPSEIKSFFALKPRAFASRATFPPLGAAPCSHRYTVDLLTPQARATSLKLKPRASRALRITFAGIAFMHMHERNDAVKRFETMHSCRLLAVCVHTTICAD
jgi:hypothetical protein